MTPSAPLLILGLLQGAVFGQIPPAVTDYKRLRELIDRYAPESKRGKIPILSGEWGYSSNTKGVSMETQAAFAVRQQLCNLLNGVPLSIWYDFPGAWAASAICGDDVGDALRRSGHQRPANQLV